MSRAQTAEATLTVGSVAWWDEYLARRARSRPRSNGLSVDRIVTEAMTLADREGATALTMRRVADHLGTGVASLYRHLASREELLALIGDSILGEVKAPPEGLEARRQVEWLAHQLRAVLLAHAALLSTLSPLPMTGPNARRGVDLALQAFTAMGLGPEEAVLAHLASMEFVLGSVSYDTAAGTAANRNNQALAAGADGSLHPTLWQLRPQMGGVSPEQVFAVGLRLMLDGLSR